MIQGHNPEMNPSLCETSILLTRKALYIINVLLTNIVKGVNTLNFKNYNEFINSKNQHEIQNLLSQQKQEMLNFLSNVRNSLICS